MTFQPGQSGNPHGRAKGVPNKARVYLDYLAPHAEQLMIKGMELAASACVGNTEGTAILKLFLERILPKPGDGVLKLGIIDGTFNQKSKRIFDIMSDGEVAVSDGQELIKALATTQSVNLEDLENRERRLMEIESTVKLIESENKRLREKIAELEGAK